MRERHRLHNSSPCEKDAQFLGTRHMHTTARTQTNTHTQTQSQMHKQEAKSPTKRPSSKIHSPRMISMQIKCWRKNKNAAAELNLKHIWSKINSAGATRSFTRTDRQTGSSPHSLSRSIQAAGPTADKYSFLFIFFVPVLHGAGGKKSCDVQKTQRVHNKRLLQMAPTRPRGRRQCANYQIKSAIVDFHLMRDELHEIYIMI